MLWQCKHNANRKTVAKGDHVHTIMCSQKTNTKTHWAVTIAHRWWPVAWAWTRQVLVFNQGQQICSAIALSLCWRSITTCAPSVICGICKSFRAPPYVLLVISYTKNYITIAQWLLGWFRDQGKKGVCIGNKVHCSPMEMGLSYCKLLHLLGIFLHTPCTGLWVWVSVSHLHLLFIPSLETLAGRLCPFVSRKNKQHCPIVAYWQHPP